MPARQIGRTLAPVQIGKPVVKIGKRAANRDRSHIKATLFNIAHIVLQKIERRFGFKRERT